MRTLSWGVLVVELFRDSVCGDEYVQARVTGLRHGCRGSGLSVLMVQRSSFRLWSIVCRVCLLLQEVSSFFVVLGMFIDT